MVVFPELRRQFPTHRFKKALERRPDASSTRTGPSFYNFPPEVVFDTSAYVSSVASEKW